MRIKKISSHLQHHGILGMHWGKTNGPPYPINQENEDDNEEEDED